MRRRSILRFLSLPVVLLLTFAMVPPAAAQDGSWIDDYLLSGSSDPFLVGAEYSWGLQQIMPAQNPTEVAVTVTFAWGDGTVPSVASSMGVNPDIGCYLDGEGQEQAWKCWVWMGHTYLKQGLYTITATASQGDSEPSAAATEAAVYDLDLGGSVKGSGVLTAREGGMYDQDFWQDPAPATFSITASRKAGTTATKVALTVSVPSMTPEWPNNTYVGMTFTSKASTRPLYIEKLPGRGNYEVFIERILGTVTNSGPYKGSAYATFHALVQRGLTTQVRIQISNTSMGFTYVDTAQPPADRENGTWQPYLTLDPTNDELVSGSIRVG